ncbi:unnamed protein product [Nezara viridula]|uniref:Peptidase S1 domain-containing protein n=1 Tax=Nezara viridula TaxID=85310 RepID=A0A9P0H925_NEZVI|nr:unnamed protein product [Nezara viridula]
MILRRFIQNILVILALCRTGIEGYNSSYENETKECKCVPYYLCENEKIITDGGPVIEPRGLMLADSVVHTYHSPRCDPLSVYCCKDKSIEPTPPRPRTQCGKRNDNFIEARAIGSTTSTLIGEFPWMIALFKIVVRSDLFSRNLKTEYFSGGALIHERIVLTSAHTVMSMKNNPSVRLMARAGEWNIQDDNEIEKHQDRVVAEIILHPNFYSKNSRNDLAILKLETPFILGYYIDIICLPPPGTIIVSGKCTLSSWGKESCNERDYRPSVLKKFDIEVVSRSQCASLYRQYRFDQSDILHDSFVCAGRKSGFDTCVGDEGSPLVCPTDLKGSTYELSGFVSSSSSSDCRNDKPRVYAGVGYAHEWIENIKNNLGD